MSPYVVTFTNVEPPARDDGVAWTGVHVEEGPSIDGPFLPLGDQVVTSWPASFTFNNAQYPDGFYVLSFVDADGAVYRWPPLQRDDFAFGWPKLHYTTRTQLREALSPGGDPDDPGSASSLDDDTLDLAIREAQSEVDAKVPGAPFTRTVPDVVATITRDIAAYLATMTHRRGEPMTVDDPVRLRYGRAKGLLDDLAKGAASVGSEGGADASGEASVVNPYDGALWQLDDLGLGPAPNRVGRPWPVADGFIR